MSGSSPAHDAAIPPSGLRTWTVRSLTTFGLAGFITALVLSVAAGGFRLDLAALLVLFIARRVNRGSAAAARWGIGCMGMYVLGGLTIVTLIMFGSGQVSISGIPVVGPLRSAWAILSVAVIFAWASLNIVGLIRLLLRVARVSRPQCPFCGYPAGASDVCTECGHPLPPGAA